MRAFREQLSKQGVIERRRTSSTRSPKTSRSGAAPESRSRAKTLLGYAQLAQNLPDGRLLQVKLENVHEHPRRQLGHRGLRTDLQNAIDAVRESRPDRFRARRPAEPRRPSQEGQGRGAGAREDDGARAQRLEHGRSRSRHEPRAGAARLQRRSAGRRGGGQLPGRQPLALGRLLRPGAERCRGCGQEHGQPFRRRLRSPRSAPRSRRWRTAPWSSSRSARPSTARCRRSSRRSSFRPSSRRR